MSEQIPFDLQTTKGATVNCKQCDYVSCLSILGLIKSLTLVTAQDSALSN